VINNSNNKNIVTELNNPSNSYAGLITNAKKDGKYLKFLYNFCGNHQIAIYSENEKKTVNISEILIDNKENIISQFLINNEEDTYVSVIYPNLLIDTYDDIGENIKQYGIYRDVNQLKSELKADDNPVIIIGKVNFDSLFR